MSFQAKKIKFELTSEVERLKEIEKDEDWKRHFWYCMCGRGDINYSQGMGKGGTKKMEGKASELEKNGV